MLSVCPTLGYGRLSLHYGTSVALLSSNTFLSVSTFEIKVLLMRFCCYNALRFSVLVDAGVKNVHTRDNEEATAASHLFNF